MVSNWNKQCVCKCCIDKDRDKWVDAHLKLFYNSSSESSDSSAVLILFYFVETRYEEWSIKLNDIICVYQIKNTSKPYTFAILAFDEFKKEVQQKVVLDLGNENSLCDWMNTLSISTTNLYKRGRQMFATSTLGEIYECVNDSVDHSQYCWYRVGGHLRNIVCGPNDLVWGLASDGTSYVRSKKQSHHIEYEEKHIVYENQRWNIVEGFTDRFAIFPGQFSEVSSSYVIENFL